MQPRERGLLASEQGFLRNSKNIKTCNPYSKSIYGKTEIDQVRHIDEQYGSNQVAILPPNHDLPIEKEPLRPLPELILLDYYLLFVYCVLTRTALCKCE